MIQVAIVSHATVITDVQLQPIVKALQLQVGHDFYPAWGINAILTHIYPPAKPPATSWVLGLFDDADQAGALGYHDVTPANLPLGKVFCKTSLDNHVSISAVASHELLEMLLDPYINLLVQDAIRARRNWAYEVCDAVEADEDGYFIQGVLVSDFVLPAYFQPTLPLKGPFDFRHVLTGPVPALSPGGYMAYEENGQWGQVFGHARGKQRPGKDGGSGRFERRQAPPAVSTFDVEAP